LDTLNDVLQLMSEGLGHANAVGTRTPVQINHVVKNTLKPKFSRVINENGLRDVFRPSRESSAVADWSVETTVTLTQDALEFLTIFVIKEAQQSAVRE
jgi:hypothetical protein